MDDIRIRRNGHADHLAIGLDRQAVNRDGHAENGVGGTENRDGHAEKRDGHADHLAIGLDRQAESQDGRAENQDGHARIQDGHTENRDVHAENRDAHAENGGGHTVNADGHASNGDGGHAENQDGHTENRDGHAENRDRHAENGVGDTENRDGHAEKRDGHAETPDGHTKNANGQAGNRDGREESRNGHAENGIGRAENQDGHARNRDGHAENRDRHAEDGGGHTDKPDRHTGNGDGHADGSATARNGRQAEVKASTGQSAASGENATPPVIRVTDLVKDYSRGESVVHALRSVSVTVTQGEFVAVMGPSGSGKSTFMNLIGCLDHPNAGSYELDGVEVTRLDATQLANLRNQKIGFIFQGFNLLPRMHALDNVMLPMLYAGVPRQIRERRGKVALEAVGLGSRMHHRSNELSGGQQQRVAIARALVNAPSLILADEPTGNLDSRTSVEIMAILQRLNQAGATIVLVTHEPDIAGFCSRTVVFKDGVVLSDQPNALPRLAASVLREWPSAEEDEAAA